MKITLIIFGSIFTIVGLWYLRTYFNKYGYINYPKIIRYPVNQIVFRTIVLSAIICWFFVFGITKLSVLSKSVSIIIVLIMGIRLFTLPYFRGYHKE